MREIHPHILQKPRSILHYSGLKLNKDFLEHMDNVAKYRDEVHRHMYEFKAVADELRVISDDLETRDDIGVNWLLRILAYEYTALAYMKFLACKNTLDDRDMAILDDCETRYMKMMEIGNAHDHYSSDLWKGYAQFDLTRVYECKYRITNDVKFINLMMEYSNNSISTRKKWFSTNNFKGVFSSALSFEYFLVCRFEYELRHKYEAYTSDSNYQILKGLAKVKDELSEFCETTEFGRLFEMKASIESLMNEVAEKKADA